uniref:Uncharacterized protein n=1 Tax=Anguilla anguilla TaxID=7936 RepID=A0A0E9QAU7_ANGAN
MELTVFSYCEFLFLQNNEYYIATVLHTVQAKSIRPSVVF